VKPDDALFNSEFLAKLEQLYLLSRRIFRGRSHGERRSREIGSSLEFADYRNYTPGDDPRSIDWNIYGRLERLFIKLYEDEEDLPVYLLLDVSASMRWEPETSRLYGEKTSQKKKHSLNKLDYTRRVAACLAYIALENLDHVDICYFDSRLGQSTGAGKGFFPKALAFLRTLPAEAGATNLLSAIDDFVRKRPRRGLAILLSDFLDPQHCEAALGLLHAGKFEVQLLHVLHPYELSPGLHGDFQLEDAETGKTLEANLNEGLIQAYRQRLGAYLESIEQFTRRRGMGYLRTDTSIPFEDFVLKTLRKQNILR